MKVGQRVFMHMYDRTLLGTVRHVYEADEDEICVQIEGDSYGWIVSDIHARMYPGLVVGTRCGCYSAAKCSIAHSSLKERISYCLLNTERITL